MSKYTHLLVKKITFSPSGNGLQIVRNDAKNRKKYKDNILYRGTSREDCKENEKKILKYL